MIDLVDAVSRTGYGAMLRRRWGVLTLAAAFGLLFAVVLPALRTDPYVATGAVLVLPTEVVSGPLGRTGGEIDMDAEARLLKSVIVATRAKALLKVFCEPQTRRAATAGLRRPGGWSHGRPKTCGR